MSRTISGGYDGTQGPWSVRAGLGSWSGQPCATHDPNRSRPRIKLEGPLPTAATATRSLCRGVTHHKSSDFADVRITGPGAARRSC
jgi:hypothetical protein